MNNANDNGERKVVSSLRDLPAAVQPPRDLWAGIEARIVAEGHIAVADPGTRKRAGSNLSRLRWMAAAAVVAALAVGMWVGRSVLPTTRPTTSPRMSTSITFTLPTNDGTAALQAAYFADPKYRKQREALVISLEAKLASLPPESQTKVISSLATIHKSIQDLEAEIGKDPSNALLQELLVNTYQDEMRVLTTVNEASDAGEGI